jgi:hypothetical protein
MPLSQSFWLICQLLSCKIYFNSKARFSIFDVLESRGSPRPRWRRRSINIDANWHDPVGSRRLV